LTAAGKDVNFNYDTRLSEIQDLDYTEAISRFSNYQTQLQAAQLSFKQINQLSLFNIL
jgi:flagellar hook-associated protein 3 FlgL